MTTQNVTFFFGEHGHHLDLVALAANTAVLSGLSCEQAQAVILRMLSPEERRSLGFTDEPPALNLGDYAVASLANPALFRRLTEVNQPELKPAVSAEPGSVYDKVAAVATERAKAKGESFEQAFDAVLMSDFALRRALGSEMAREICR